MLQQDAQTIRGRQERFDNILSSVKGEKLYSVPILLGSKSFHRSFGLPSKSMVSSGKDGGEDVPVGKVALVAGHEVESHHSRDAPRRDNNSQEGSVKYIGTIRKEMKRILPRLLNLKMLRLLGGKLETQS